MRDILILLVFLGISSFIKKMMKGNKARGQRPQRKPATGPDRRERIVGAIGELLGMEEPDDFERPSTPHPETAAAEQERTYPDITDGPHTDEPARVRKRPTASPAVRKKRHGSLRRGIVLREVLGPCRALRPFGAD